MQTYFIYGLSLTLDSGFISISENWRIGSKYVLTNNIKYKQTTDYAKRFFRCVATKMAVFEGFLYTEKEPLE